MNMEIIFRRPIGAALVAGCIVLVASAARLMGDSIAYETTGSGTFGTIDLNTGTFTQLGTNTTLLAGLGVFGGNLYGQLYDGSTSQLYQVNTANGALTAVGTSPPNISIVAEGSTLSGLYALGTNLNLYSVDSGTGAMTLIGSTAAAGAGGYYGLSTNSGTLYYTDGSSLYTLNTSNATPTLIGSTGEEIGALVLEGGSLYGGVRSSYRIDTLDTATGAATAGPTQTISQDFFGLAPAPSTSTLPLPTSAAGGFFLAAAAWALNAGRKRWMLPA
jgi:hypothetical protein